MHISKLNRTELVLVLPRGQSLTTWEAAGVLNRELALYKAIAPDLYGVTIISFAGRKELKLQDSMEKIDIIANSKCLPVSLFLRDAAKKISQTAARHHIIKAQGLAASKEAKKLAAALDSPLLVCSGRSGKKHKGQDVEGLEKEAFMAADRIIVPNETFKERISSRYKVASSRLCVIPNCVDTELFHPTLSLPKRRGQVLFVGDLDENNNLQILMQALNRVSGARLLVVGEGATCKSLVREVRSKSLKADLVGSRPYEDLPSYYNSCEIFVVLSGAGGQSIALLEAMACGACVIGADVPGIREIINDDMDGILADLSVEGLGKAVKECLNDPAMAGRLGRKARQKAKKFNLDKAVQLEKKLYKELIGSASTVASEFPSASKPVSSS